MGTLKHLAEVFSDLSGMGKERRLKAIMNAVMGPVLRNCYKDDIVRGVIRQAGNYTTYGALDVFGREAGTRVLDASFIIAQDGRKLFDFRRDSIEIELDGADVCDIAPGRWYRDFIRACETGPVRNVGFRHGFRHGFAPINEQRFFGKSTHRALELFNAHQSCSVAWAKPARVAETSAQREARRLMARLRTGTSQIGRNPT